MTGRVVPASPHAACAPQQERKAGTCLARVRDPLITTGLSLWGLWHEFPDSSILEGGQLWATALQARVAITDRIAFIATKDGWVSFRPGNPLVAQDGGFTDITVGFKGSLIDDQQEPRGGTRLRQRRFPRRRR
jgi:hypothetical protein